ncbi:SORC3 protein, partial [Polypterus senegalus]
MEATQSRKVLFLHSLLAALKDNDRVALFKLLYISQATLQMSKLTASAQYITCKLQNCTEANKGKPFPGHIDPNSLVVQDEYVFVQDMHVISTDENRVVAAVQEWNQNDTYNLYVSDVQGVFFTLALENVMSSHGLEGNIMIDLYEVAGIKGMFLANKKLENQVKTYITYNKGRDWRLLQAPEADLRGNEFHCHLPWAHVFPVSHRPNTVPSTKHTKTTLSCSTTPPRQHRPLPPDSGLDCWEAGPFIPHLEVFQVPDQLVLIAPPGGADKPSSVVAGSLQHPLAATPSPNRAAVVDSMSHGATGEIEERSTAREPAPKRPGGGIVGTELSSRNVSMFITSDAGNTWRQGDPCIMGMKRIYRKLKPPARCIMGREHSLTMTSEPCLCTQSDFECDYGYERRSDGKCLPAFWFNPSSIARSCTAGKSFLNSTGYRKVVSNNCTAGVKEIFTAKKEQCPSRPPRGLHLVTSDSKLTATQGTNVTFLIFLEEGEGPRTSIMLDFGDGNAISYSNVSSIEDGIKHNYKNVGIYKVVAVAENNLGSDSAVLYLHVICRLDHVHLSAPFVAVKNKEVNLTVVLSPSQVGTITYIWWLEYFRSHLLAFSSNLDEYNPDVVEWRQDISRVIKNSLVQATGIAEKQLLVSVLPGLPTAAEFFVLPDKEITEGKPERNAAHVDQLSEILLNALNQNLVQFTLRPGVQINVYAAHLSAAPLVDTSEGHSGSAMMMLLSVVFVGLAVFVIYKFKRKIPGINVYAQMQNEKEQEMISPVSPSESTPNTQRDLVTSLEILDEELDTRAIVNGTVMKTEKSEKVCGIQKIAWIRPHSSNPRDLLQASQIKKSLPKEGETVQLFFGKIDYEKNLYKNKTYLQNTLKTEETPQRH